MKFLKTLFVLLSLSLAGMLAAQAEDYAVGKEQRPPAEHIDYVTNLKKKEDVGKAIEEMFIVVFGCMPSIRSHLSVAQVKRMSVWRRKAGSSRRAIRRGRGPSIPDHAASWRSSQR
jgi:hypothetical protein